MTIASSSPKGPWHHLHVCKIRFFVQYNFPLEHPNTPRVRGIENILSISHSWSPWMLYKGGVGPEKGRNGMPWWGLSTHHSCDYEEVKYLEKTQEFKGIPTGEHHLPLSLPPARVWRSVAEMMGMPGFLTPAAPQKPCGTGSWVRVLPHSLMLGTTKPSTGLLLEQLGCATP
jgi:hypothetical protein